MSPRYSEFAANNPVGTEHILPISSFTVSAGTCSVNLKFGLNSVEIRSLFLPHRLRAPAGREAGLTEAPQGMDNGLDTEASSVDCVAALLVSSGSGTT
jgi:hypothetical protein